MKLLKTSFLLAAAGASIHAQGQSMTDLGTLGGNYSTAHAISGKRAVVVGNANNASNQGRAFRWTSAGMVDLGTLGGDYSYAWGVSANGAVVGESKLANGQTRAFRWTSAGMVDLGTLGGNYSYARAVSADGSVVVGRAYDAIGLDHAFRWTSAGMVDLGTLGGPWSGAEAVSADGAVVVGYARDADNQLRAFRWTSAGMVNLGTLGGNFSYNFSYARAVSANGAVVVGDAALAYGQTRAFRWTSAGMVDLGTLGGDYSIARAASADGAVVVGYANNASNQGRAFRWTSAGMVDLGTLGGDYSYAWGVSANGAVVVGESKLANGQTRAFLYSHRAMLDVQDWLGSVGGVHSTLSTGLELSRTFMEGAHHRPLAELGRGRSYWATGDIAGSSRSRDLITRSGEAGVTFEAAPDVLIGVGGGYGRQDQQLANGGSASSYGQYLVGEVDFIRPNGGIFSVLVSAGDWRANMDRGYVTGGGVDYSHGETDLQSTSVRLRYDTPVLTKALGAEIKAYLSGSLSKAQSDAYSETGGSFAGSFGELEQTAKEGRLGVAATRSFTEKLRGRLSVEWIRRFDSYQAVLTATDITSTLDLSLPGVAVQRDQARIGFDLDYLMDAKTTLSFTVHAAGRGESPDVSGAISLRRGF